MGIIDKLNKDFESRVRLGIMSILMVNDWVDFTEMKTLLDITDGNLASHSFALEKGAYIEIKILEVLEACISQLGHCIVRITKHNPFGMVNPLTQYRS